MRIAVLISGGVDSSVALRLLAAEGHDVHAFYLKVWLADEMAHLGTCPWQDDLRYARAVCEQIDVPLTIVPLQQAYHEKVVAAVLEELAAGRTPSPDIGCNRHVKFGAFFTELDRLGQPFDRVATGHYARVDRARVGRDDVDRARLLRGVDPVKDQTYFLYRLDPAQVARLLFPLGHLRKAEVRALAEELDLPNRARPDSQGICFLGGVRYDDFVRASLGERPGWVRDAASGRRLGRHQGVWFHTIGQRRGLGLGGGPWYVVAKDVERELVWVIHGDALPAWQARRFRIPSPWWIDGPPAELISAGEAALTVKVRHTPLAVRCRVRAESDAGGEHRGEHGSELSGDDTTAYGSLEVTLDQADPGLADGQPAVLYDGDLCLGGGVMTTGVDPRALPAATLTSSCDRASNK